MFDLNGRCALVTGASGSIGGAIARALNERGTDVALSGTRGEALEALAGELGDGAWVVPADLASADGAEQLAKDAEAAVGGVDILVNNAGLTRDGLAMRIKNEDWNTVLDVNLSAAFRLTRACLRGMMKKRWGRVISITSIVGVTGNPGQANYAASKAGMIGMTKSVAKELGSRGVRCNALAPGFIRTDMTAELSEDQIESLQSLIPLGRLGETDDISGVVRFLVSPAARYITGQVLAVDGGMVM